MRNVRRLARIEHMKQSLGLVSLVVRDYDEAIAFFVGVLGFTLVEDSLYPSGQPQLPDETWFRQSAGP